MQNLSTSARSKLSSTARVFVLAELGEQLADRGGILGGVSRRGEDRLERRSGLFARVLLCDDPADADPSPARVVESQPQVGRDRYEDGLRRRGPREGHVRFEAD